MIKSPSLLELALASSTLADVRVKTVYSSN